MKLIRRIFAFMLCILFIAGAAAAEGAPSSQFGFKGWPYRKGYPCARSTAAPTRAVRPASTPRPTAAAQPDTSADVGDYTTLSVSAQEYSAWNLVNADRLANGLSELPLDEELCAIARVKARDMEENRYFSHTSPTYGRPAAMLTHFGYSFKSVSENIAHYGTVEKAEAGFMSSASHRAAILGSQWQRMGVGVWQDANGFVYVVQLFVR